MADFLMPALGADMEKGKLVQWRVAAGSRVQPGDLVAVVETQKGAIDVEIFDEGVIDDLVPAGTELPVGGLLARVRAAAGAPPAPVEPGTASRARVTPAARRRAGELGIDVAGLRGTGPDGSVTVGDVEAAASKSAPPAPAAAEPAVHGFDPAQMRAAIAATVSRSKREIPHYYLLQAVDFGACDAWLTQYNADRPPAQRLLPAVLLLKATARALAAVPQLNGFYQDGAVRLLREIHVGWAVALRGGGLIAPAIHDADRKSLPDLMRAMRDLVQRARTGGLRSSELTDATVTVTSLGERGADSVQGVIVPPQLAIIGFGRIARQPWVVGDQVVVRPLVQVSLAADHRASDGHVGGLLLAAIQDALQQPDRLHGSNE